MKGLYTIEYFWFLGYVSYNKAPEKFQVPCLLDHEEHSAEVEELIIGG
jgi:hypothetical protein